MKIWKRVQSVWPNWFGRDSEAMKVLVEPQPANGDGHLALARESLREFKRRYPDAELPEDLKPLAATLTTP